MEKAQFNKNGTEYQAWLDQDGKDFGESHTVCVIVQSVGGTERAFPYSLDDRHIVKWNPFLPRDAAEMAVKVLGLDTRLAEEDQVATEEIAQALEEGLEIDDARYMAAGAVNRLNWGEVQSISPEMNARSLKVAENALSRMGRPPVEERKQAEQVMLEPSVTAKVEALAKAQGKTKSAMLRELLLKALQ